jgi:hypothetical protein
MKKPDFKDMGEKRSRKLQEELGLEVTGRGRERHKKSDDLPCIRENDNRWECTLYLGHNDGKQVQLLWTYNKSEINAKGKIYTIGNQLLMFVREKSMANKKSEEPAFREENIRYTRETKLTDAKKERARLEAEWNAGKLKVYPIPDSEE